VRAGPDERLGRHTRRTVFGRPLPSRATLTSLAIVLVLSVVPVAVPLLVIRNDATRSLPIGPATAAAAPAPSGGDRVSGRAPTQANSSGSIAGGGPATSPAPTVANGSTGAHPPAAPRPHGPDLIVVSVAYTPAEPHTGDQMRFSAVVKNIGDEASPPITHGVGFLVDGVTVAWTGASSAAVPAGQERTYAADAGPSGPPVWVATRGGHELKAWVDDINRFPETNEDNNTKALQFNVL
jgi:hypothetical protein